MEIILRKAMPKLGKPGEKVKVADGYARNYLIPQGFAFHATPSNMKKLQLDNVLEEKRKIKRAEKAKELAHRIKKMSCTIVKQVSEGEKLFGSVTTQDIVKGLEAEGISLEKKQVLLEQPIKTLGIYPVRIKLTSDIETVLKVWVVR